MGHGFARRVQKRTLETAEVSGLRMAGSGQSKRGQQQAGKGLQARGTNVHGTGSRERSRGVEGAAKAYAEAATLAAWQGRVTSGDAEQPKSRIGKPYIKTSSG